MEKQNKQYSQWKAMLAITQASLRSITRSPSAVIFSLGFPLVFIVVFGFISGNRIRLEVGVDERCDTTTTLYQSILKIPNVELITDKSEAELKQQLIKGRVDAILYIHPGKDSAAGKIVELITSKASREKGSFVQSVLTNLIDKQNISFFRTLSKDQESQETGTGNWANNLAQLKQSEIEGREYKMIDFILPGQLGFSILSAGVFGTAFVFFSLRQTLVLKRFFATPISRTFIVLGEALSRLIFQLAGSLIIILIGKYVFGFTLINGFTTLIEMLLLSALGLIVFMGFGFVVSGLAKSESVIPPLANIVTLPQFLLSGTFFPIDAFPPWLQTICKGLPLTYLNDALRKVAFEGAGLMDISHQILVIALWGVIVYIAAIRFFRWE
ncbi:MAG: ABC transporter permease [Bacteroidetes bacterium]|nr:ABC transporter permease [Bacteroidota bacterium]MBP6401050.1 ABC transporter permease [Bacteroidia bacterium]MBK9524629.1 ABC transporter permease [Bacteroidota bacterium]MBK9542026.1 ABC transporter permease [Bacteroidota bacterium]MBL0259294.1 ABC transporter permease [Bacteroidota bacterium]